MKIIIAAVLLLNSLMVIANVPPNRRPGYCKLEINKSCEQLLKSKLSRWDQNDDYELRQITNSCAGNYGTSCLKTIMKPLARWEKNNLEDLSRLATSCQLTQQPCLNFVTSKLSSIEFNSIEDVTEVARSCARSDVQCIKQKCNTRQYRCSNKEDLLRAAEQCYKICK